MVERGEHLVLDLAFHLLAGVFVNHTCVPQKLVIGLDWAERFPCFPLRDVAVTGFAVVSGAAMGAEAVDRCLDEGRSAAFTRALDAWVAELRRDYEKAPPPGAAVAAIREAA